MSNEGQSYLSKPFTFENWVSVNPHPHLDWGKIPNNTGYLSGNLFNLPLLPCGY